MEKRQNGTELESVINDGVYTIHSYVVITTELLVSWYYLIGSEAGNIYTPAIE